MSSNVTSKWPAIFPADCPPVDAIVASGEAHRLIFEKKQRPLCAKDFESMKERQPNRTEWMPGATPCSLCAISIVRDYDESIKLAQILLALPTYRTKKAFIARGTLKSKHGVIQHLTDDEHQIESHYDWWKPSGVDPVPDFAYCDITVEQA